MLTENGAPNRHSRQSKAQSAKPCPCSSLCYTTLSNMASRYGLICVVFASIIYLTIAFLDVSSHLSTHLSPRDVRQSLSVAPAENDSHQLDDNQLDDDQGKKVRFRSRVSYCGTPFCGYVTCLLFLKTFVLHHSHAYHHNIIICCVV